MDYKEKIKTAKELLKEADAIEYNLPDSAHAIRTTVYSLFPELRESDDERLRKEIIAYFKQFDNGELRGVDISDWIYWLEKQGEKSKIGVQESYKETLYKIATILSEHEDKEGSPLEQIRSVVVDGTLSVMDLEKKELKKIEQKPVEKLSKAQEYTLNRIVEYLEDNDCPEEWKDLLMGIHDAPYIKQKPAWSKEDEEILQDALDTIEAYSNGLSPVANSVANWEDIYQWLKTLKDRYVPLPKHEWSEEDEKVFRSLSNALARISSNTRTDSTSVNYSFFTEIEWLKSLKDRVIPQPKQEWSEEDEIGLGDALWCCKQAASIASDENDMGNAWYAETWLKAVKERYTYKPSDEQMENLSRACNGRTYRTSLLMELYQDLRKLKN